MLSSFIIRYHTRRLDNLLQTLRFLELWHLPVIQQSEIILCCQDRCGKIKTQFKKTSNFNMELPEMMMAYQLNFGVKQAESDHIVLLDSDRILPLGYFQRTLTQLRPKTMISCACMNQLTAMVSDEDIIQNNFSFNEEIRSQNNNSLQRNIFSGNVVFNKKDYWEAGGADEDYVGYGWEDHDLTERMTAIGVKSIFQDDKEIHLYHERFTYGSSDQDKLFVKNGIRYCRKWNKPYPRLLTQKMRIFV